MSALRDADPYEMVNLVPALCRHQVEPDPAEMAEQYGIGGRFAGDRAMGCAEPSGDPRSLERAHRWRAARPATAAPAMSGRKLGEVV
jgi:hypothetical protein